MQRRGPAATLIALACAVAIAGVSYVGYHRAPAQAELIQPDRSATGVAAFLDVRAELTEEPAEPVEPEAIDARRAAFEERYPAQAAATEAPGHGGDGWALLIGINEHLGAVPNNFVSREDAERMRELLLRAGWADDRIVLMTDTDATGDMIREGLAWLARKSGQGSTVVFHYSGHSKKWYGPGGRIDDQALWPTDDDFVRRGELAEALAEVDHDAFWGNVAACEAAGFHLDGVAAPDRVWTYSSRADEKSYEDPGAGHSVWGAYLLDHGLWRAGQDPPSVQEAFAEAAPQAQRYTSLQVPYGPQTPVLEDDLGRPFELSPAPDRLTPSFG
ncbi:caspase family protein [Nitriliruptor alkaliphilus]|uniref:caspase family protein n=1 Tax=Nitriliruptor alkaliphilus TaxID=427918 RepID=UPI0006966036|nr:caspase family protein [Nitriliruptor alkaliphilus]